MSPTIPARVPATSEEALLALGTPDAEVRRLVVRSLERAPTDAARAVLATVLSDDDWRVRKEAIQLAHALADRADVVPILVEALRAPSEAVALRNAAVEALAGLGIAAVQAVEEALATQTLDEDGRKLAIEVLAAARQPRAIPTVIRALDDRDANVRAAAAEALGLIGGDDAAAALLMLLSREDRYLRLVALEGLNRIGTEVPLARLRPFLGDKILRHAAVAALARTGDPAAIVPLVQALGDPSRHVAETALRAVALLLREPASDDRAALRALPPQGRERVVVALVSSDTLLRRGAIHVLAALGDAPAIESLVRALHDDELAEEVETALFSIGFSAMPALLEVARRGDVEARVAVLPILARLSQDALSRDTPEGTKAAAAVIDVLREGVRDPHAEIVAASSSAFAAALTAGAEPNAADVHALLRAAASLDAKTSAIALQTLRTLARRMPDAVRPHLVHVDTRDDEARVVCALLAVVGGSEHVAWLSRAVSAESARTRRAAVEALGQIGGEAAAAPLGYALTDEVSEVSLTAIKALGRLRDDSGLHAPGANALLRMLEGPHSQSREDVSIVSAAVRALGATGDPRAATALRPLVASNEVAVACAALEGLADLRGRGTETDAISSDELQAIAFGALGHPSSVVVRTALDVLDALVDVVPIPLPAAATDSGRISILLARLAPTLAHPSWEVRRRAVELVGRLDPASVRALLASRASEENEPAVREALDRALATLDTQGRSGRTSRPPPRTGDD